MAQQDWWQAADGRWYPPTSHASHEWTGRPLHVRTGCGGLTGSILLTVVAFLILGSGHIGLILLLVPLVIVVMIFSFLRMLGRSIRMLSTISDGAWQEAHRHAQERLAEQLRYFEAQQRGAGSGPFGSGQSGSGSRSTHFSGRPAPPGPARDTSQWAEGVLGVRPGATPVEVRHAFREASKRWHPDLFMQASPAERADAARHMEDINAAHAVLTGGSSRRVA